MQSINEVLSRLEQIIEQAKEQESPLGYFPAVYYNMTAAIRNGIAQGKFENGSRMEQLDVRFAQRYFDAFDAWQAGKPASKSWQAAFEASKNNRLTVLQHILLGINAHINLDLGIATSQTRSGDAVLGLKKDFDCVNDIIASLTERVQEQLAAIWLPMTIVDYLLRSEDEGWINFSIRVARGAAWKAATALAFTRQHETETALIQDLDTGVSMLAGRLVNPGFGARLGLRLMRRTEHGSVREKIEALVLMNDER